MKIKYYIIETAERLSDYKVVGGCYSRKRAEEMREIYKEGNPISYFEVVEVLN